MILREAGEDDIQGLLDVMDSVASEGRYTPAERIHDLQRELIAKSIKEKAGWLVAEMDGRIVGEGNLHSQRFRTKSQHVAVLGMNILKNYRGIGIGNAMMDYMISWAKERGYKKISLSVFSTNQPAINLYKKFGFEIEGVKKREFKINGEYVDEILMALFL